eukprot:3985874-Pleurochrysis_carterae.AAC.2
MSAASNGGARRQRSLHLAGSTGCETLALVAEIDAGYSSRTHLKACHAFEDCYFLPFWGATCALAIIAVRLQRREISKSAEHVKELLIEDCFS